MAWNTVCCVVFLTATLIGTWCQENGDGLKLVTVATNSTDGFSRFMKSAKKFNFDVQVLGMGHKWEGGDVDKYAGGGQKIILFREAMEKLKDEKDLLVMFTDSYDVILTAGTDEVKKIFSKLGARVLFSAEGFCWPDATLADKYPIVKPSEKRFLNSGGFIGYAPEIYEIVSHHDVRNDDDDQLYYTNIFLNKALRDKYSMKLDTRGEIFQNLHGALDEVQLKFKGSKSYLYNFHSGTTPIVIHGNGPIKQYLHTLGNYIPDLWTPLSGCQVCKEDTISLDGIKLEDYPSVYAALFLEQATAFAEDFFDKFGALNYPKEKITLFIHYADKLNDKDIKNFMDKYGVRYQNVELHGPSNMLEERVARNKALEGCIEATSQYFFSLDGDAQLESANTLVHLIEQNRSVIAPMLVRPGKSWSNFWGDLSKDGFYSRSEDYMDIIQSQKRGLWNVPYMTGAYLIHGNQIHRLLGSYSNGRLDTDMSFCKTMRELGIFMYVDNQDYYGHLVDSEAYDQTRMHGDLYEMFNNKYTWEQKYLHKDYHISLQEDAVVEQPCPDVFWMPLVSAKFCQDYIEEMENFGQWSSGGSKDPRLAGGYENVPTVDIHTNQIGWERHWLQILQDYISPLANKLFKGYYSEGRAIMNFVVRYKPTEQDRLRPHADSSTYTINVALNTPQIDYQGGGVRFLRYNCTLTDMRLGWFLMHPGRLTHHHEGLQTTGGTRYIMVSFVDP